MNELVKGAFVVLAATALLAGCAPMDTAASEYDEAEIGTTAEALVASTGSLVTAHAEASAVLLPNGKVLLPGGRSPYGSSSVPTTAVDLYDPALGTWSAAPKMLGHHWNSTATLLNDGRVLLSGTTTPELYTASTNSWATTGAMVMNRSWHSATLLADGRVLAAGGKTDNNTTVATAEIYNPVTATWSATGSMGVARQGPTLVTLKSGKVLAISGLYNSAVISTCEIYDPATGTWASAYAPPTLLSHSTATLLNDGRVLLAGGDANNTSGTFSNAAWLYNPATGTWSATASMAAARSWHMATLLANGKVLIAGGISSVYVTSLELYDPATGTWSSAGAMSVPQSMAGAVRLGSGAVLLAGGYGNPFPVPIKSAEIYTP